jgi:dihydrolipoamide dehydrogenase
MKYDLIVIGGGPAGYVGAIRAAQLGKKVACVEKERAGGTCLNWGCIPTKALLKNAETYNFLKHEAEAFGFSFDNLQFDWTTIINRSRKVSDKLAGGVEGLFKKNKVDYLKGTGFIDQGNKVRVVDAAGKTTTYEADKILVTTGVVSRDLPILPFNGSTIIGSRDALVLKERPASIVIIGAGAIGVEFAYFFNSFGTEVTLVEMMPQILPVEDTDTAQVVQRAFTKQGIRVLTETKTVGATADKNGVTVEVEKGGKKETIKASAALVAVGVKALLPEGTAKLELTERGYIKVDANYKTNLEGVYAAGDIIGPPWLAHVASWEALQVIEHLFEGHKPKKIDIFPGCTYCQPQVASVGLTERALKEKGIPFKVGKFPFQASGKALAAGHADGFVKVLVGEKHGEILGAHIVGHDATELIAELTLAMEMEATWEEIEATVHAHPTLAEAVHEAIGASQGRAINF